MKTTAYNINHTEEEQNPIPYIEKILKECSEAMESFKETWDITKIIWFTQRCIPSMEALEQWARNEDFKQCLKKYDTWVARRSINGHENVIVKIDNIDWEREVISWHNTTEEYPKGGCVFYSFQDDFIPIRN